MKKPLLTVVLLLMAAFAALAAAQAPDREALKARIEQRYDVVPIANGVALTPKSRRSDVRLVEISDTIAINGDAVSGGELRRRLGSDADAILQLSYLDVAALREMFPPPQPKPEVAAPRAEASEPTPSAEPRHDEARRRNRSRGDRVRVFGSVRVDAGEEIGGQAVAVFGNVRVDGVVNDQVVAVFGDVTLGPNAIVYGDIVSVGGRVNKAATAQVRGGVTEVAVGHVELPDNVAPWLAGVGLYSLTDGFGALPRLIASMFRLLMLTILASIAYLVARRTVENSAERIRENPAKATFIGIAAALLIGPLLFIITIVLVLTLIGIPLLVLMPFAIIFLGLMALAGFSGSAYAIGQWVGRRFGGVSGTGLGTVIVGVVAILTPVMIARLIAFGGWATAPFAFLVAALAFCFELLVWCAGFGAVTTNAMTGWQARRAARLVPPAAPAGSVGP